MAASVTLERDAEYPPAHEKESIEQVIRDSEAILKMGNGPVLRGQHAKATGGVRAKFIIDPERPNETRFGVFEENRTFDAIVRFSNGKGRLQPDNKADARGMAIKILGVRGPRLLDEDGDQTTQDFVMINHSVFAFKNARQYAKFTALKRRLISVVGARGNELAQLLFLSVPWRWPQLKIGLKLKHKSASPLSEQYWSMSPFRLGRRAIKFTARPQSVNLDSLPKDNATNKDHDDLLLQALANHLRVSEARFDFMVQFQSDPVAMPIEDPTVEWDESKSPLIKVATVLIETVDLLSTDNLQFRKTCDAMSFNPWHSLVDHMPLGGINRLRRGVYQSNAQMRRDSFEHKVSN